MSRTLFIALGLACLSVLAPAQLGTGGLGGGGALHQPQGDCLSAVDVARAHADLAAYMAAQPETAGTLDPPQALIYYPLGALFREDMGISHYVDLDTDPGSTLDYACGTVTYDGHDASDALIRGFDEQTIGVPVYAVADGVVIGTHDGEPDMNTQALGQPSNYVIVDHGGRVGWYWHLKNGSVLVSDGQTVQAGEEIGRCGSSGNSNFPHLHFAYTENGAPLEPYKGPCRPGLSHWADQPPIPSQTVFHDAAVSRATPGLGAPFSLPRDHEILLTDPVVYIWFHVNDMPANTTWRFVFEQPNGTIDFDSGVGNFNNPQWGSAWFWFNWNVFNMHVITGTWIIHIEMNGVEVAALPVDVVASLTPGLNHAPEPITVALDPAEPSAADALRCRVTSDPLLDDLDYDVVSHRFHWRVNGATVRDETLGGRSDQLPRAHYSVGDTVTCEVTASDGALSAALVTASVTIGAGHPGSGDDLELRTGIDAHPALLSHVVEVDPGDPLLVHIISPGGAQTGLPPFLVGQFFGTGTPPSSPPGFSEVHVNPANTIHVLLNGNTASALGPILLPPGGLTLLFNIPAGLSGQSFMMQDIAVNASAQNGFFASSNAKEIRFL